MDIILTQSIRTSHAHSLAHIVTYRHTLRCTTAPYVYPIPTYIRTLPYTYATCLRYSYVTCTSSRRHSFATHSSHIRHICTPLVTPHVRLIPYPYYVIYITCRISFTFVHSLR